MRNVAFWDIMFSNVNGSGSLSHACDTGNTRHSWHATLRKRKKLLPVPHSLGRSNTEKSNHTNNTLRTNVSVEITSIKC